MPAEPGDATIQPVESGEPLLYREEVTAILGAMADLVVEVRRIRRLLEDEEKNDEEGEV